MNILKGEWGGDNPGDYREQLAFQLLLIATMLDCGSNLLALLKISSLALSLSLSHSRSPSPSPLPSFLSFLPFFSWGRVSHWPETNLALLEYLQV